MLIGFDNMKEANRYWNYLGLNKHTACTQYCCAGREELIKKEMPFPLSALDHFSLSVNCMAFIDMPRTVYDKVKHKLEDVSSNAVSPE